MMSGWKKKQSMGDRHQMLSDDERVKEKAVDERSSIGAERWWAGERKSSRWAIVTSCWAMMSGWKKKQSMSDRHQLMSDDERVKEKAVDERSSIGAERWWAGERKSSRWAIVTSWWAMMSGCQEIWRWAIVTRCWAMMSGWKKKQSMSDRHNSCWAMMSGWKKKKQSISDCLCVS
jgi:hypothetical protein